MLPFWVQLRPNLKKFDRLLLDCGRCGQHVERLFAQASSIARERGQVRQPTAEAVYRQSVDGLLAGRFLRADSERVPETPCWCAAPALPLDLRRRITAAPAPGASAAPCTTTPAPSPARLGDDQSVCLSDPRSSGWERCAPPSTGFIGRCHLLTGEVAGGHTG